MSKTLYCNLSIHAKYLSRRSVFKVCCKSREKFQQLVSVAYFQLLYAVVTRLDFMKFIGCKSATSLGISQCPIPSWYCILDSAGYLFNLHVRYYVFQDQDTKLLAVAQASFVKEHERMPVSWRSIGMERAE